MHILDTIEIKFIKRTTRSKALPVAGFRVLDRKYNLLEIDASSWLLRRSNINFALVK